MLLLLLLPGLLAALQQTPGRCDISQRENSFTSCTSCSAAPHSRCQHGFNKLKGTSQNCSYQVHIGGRELLLSGCRSSCVKSYMMPTCCPQYWGAMCLPCPSWSGKTCSFKGVCLDGSNRNGTCQCEDGFSGFACQECQNPNAYGENCEKQCDCVHGVCNKGPEGDGQCFCTPPYTGRRCDQVSALCSDCGSYSYCKEGGACECLPGFRKSQKNTCSSVCSQRDCDPNAECSSQGSKVTCSCKPDYEGDGKLCVPRNPCSLNNGGCPANSTVCVFTGPNKSTCRCMFGMSPLGGGAESGCQLLSACSPDSCHSTATCRTELDGHPRCECVSGQIGDGYRCYGNLMERLLEMDRSGEQRGNLTGAAAVFDRGCSMLLSHSGPFTLFVPLMKTPPSGVNEEAWCKNHLILGQHLYRELEGRDVNLYGGGRLRTKEHKRFILLDDPGRLYSVLQEDFPAANGVIHLIDRPISSRLSERFTRDERFADKTIREILMKDDRFNRFLSLVDNCGAPPPLGGAGPLTVFVPSNGAVDRARDGSILYMLTQAKHKLQELLRHHVYSQAALTLDELAVLSHLQTTANQKVVVTVSDEGDVLLGEKGVKLASANIMAANGVIHVIEGLLYPPSILPVLPHRCDVISSKVTTGPCIHCSYFLSQTECPPGSTQLDSHLIGCEYASSPLRVNKGCSLYCNTTTTVSECCPGFFGPDCKPCIGGFQHPCYGKGTCFDGIHGNGSCSCHSGFRGVACHICADPTKHGADCDEECRCLHGVCDNRPGSRGVCRVGSCLDGFSGELCDKKATPCNSDGRLEHCHVHAYCTHIGVLTVCVCRDGYEGNGLSCAAINLCLKKNRGGCDTNADCVFVGPGNVSCVCSEGWSGDGRVCVEINNCQLETRGGCSPNADCQNLGPGQSQCVCKTGYMGNGFVCDLVKTCLTQNGGCHALALCEEKDGGAPTCTCPDGYVGDGKLCYGSLLDELDMTTKFYLFYYMVQRSPEVMKDLDQNLTVLVPSNKALRALSSEDDAFWNGRHHLDHFLRAHLLRGVYSVEDLDLLVGTRLQTLHPPTQWEVTNSSGVLRIGNASISVSNLPAINGVLHVVDTVLAPPPSSLPPEPPFLSAFLNSSSNFSLFRHYAQLYNLSSELGSAPFTLLLPTDDAIRTFLSSTNSSVLPSDVFKYHVVLKELLFPDRLSHDLLKSSLLDSEHQLHFYLDQNNQTLVNEVPLDGSFIETQLGIILVLHQVLEVQRNKCGKTINLQVNGRCTDCDGPPRCTFNSQPVRPVFPSSMASNCRYRKRVGSRRKTVPGCVVKCLRPTKDHSCCPGYFGHECFKCPGEAGLPCSAHGECQDGNHGNGECRCYEGFHGTACEDCEPGRYGVNCSSKCVCNRGKCHDGLTGSGKCECYKGWRGTTCSAEIKDDACEGVCDENANCITGPQGTAAVCVCVAGYQGNGTHCTELDVCSRSNGGCSPFASCQKVSAGERTCSCSPGYSGDGVVCLEVDGCLVNNGGCHPSAECSRAGPNKTSCQCGFGFQGSGRSCSPVNPCRTNNGGCSRYAVCEYLGKGRGRNCSCLRSHIGDGFDCRGLTEKEIHRQPDNAFFSQMLQMTSVPMLRGDGPFTVFSSLLATNTSLLSLWRKSGRITELVFNHVVSCERLTFNDLKTTQRAVTLAGFTLEFTLKQGEVWINNVSRVVRSDYSTFNGVIHHIDSLLPPYRLEEQPAVPQMNLSAAASFYGYTRFYKLLEAGGVLPLLQMSVHQPLTMFWPSDAALDALPSERWSWLTSPAHREQLAALLRAHVIRNVRVMSISMTDRFSTYRTMHGSSVNFKCDRTLVGSIMVSSGGVRVIQRHMTFREGVAYGLDQLLEPPGLGAHCDQLDNRTAYGLCGRCSNTPRCSIRYFDTGQKLPCLNLRSRFSVSSAGFGRMGCKRVCLNPSWVPKCCQNHYGRDCQVCPGGLEASCSNHGDCDDGYQGSGTCRCSPGFRGTACSTCERGYWGPNCTECLCGLNGSCDDGLDGSGSCSCRSGWDGERCQRREGSTPPECRSCPPEAVCVPEVGCRCKTGFQGNGTFCSPETPADLCSEYNGGCHQNAVCSQTGRAVNCSCQAGYRGDGYSCQPINRCVEEPNGGCSDYAECSFTGPNQRVCVCVRGFVGNGVQCLEKVSPPVDRCLQENGGCDPVASCRDLHYHGKTAGVFHLRAAEGKYKMNYSRADDACREEGGRLASYKELGDAQQLGMHLCVAGWMAGGRVGYPTGFPSPRCGENHVGLVMYKEPVDQSSLYDAYCYRLYDVSCSCPADYVGTGDFCHGVLTSVLAAYNNFSLFYGLLLEYGRSSPSGQQLVDLLSLRQTNIMLFVPHNAGFSQNQSLSHRDLEYHVSTNHSVRQFDSFKHQEVIKSRLGSSLTVTHGNSPSQKRLNQRLFVQWDVPAVNGIIHVLEAPLLAPPPPIFHEAVRRHATSSATMSAILVLLLLACVMAALGCYVYKHKTDAFRFHYFRNEGDADGGNKPTLVSIPNPLYSGGSAFSQETPQQEAEPEEPPSLLDLDQ